MDAEIRKNASKKIGLVKIKLATYGFEKGPEAYNLSDERFHCKILVVT
jgi:hypothetical protein